MLEDVQDRPDDRQLPIDEVGISGIRYPVAVWDREHGKQDTVAEVSMSVDLRPEVKGAHLSRFVEVLHDCAGELSPHTMPVILGKLRQRLGSRRAQLRASFPYFLRRAAPVTGSAALMDYQCQLSGHSDGSGTVLTLAVRVPVTSVCPCSKAISDYGAHNQRGHITMRVQPRDDDDGAACHGVDRGTHRDRGGVGLQPGFPAAQAPRRTSRDHARARPSGVRRGHGPRRGARAER